MQETTVMLPSWFMQFVCVGGVLVLIGVVVGVVLVLTGKKDQQPHDRDERP